MRLGATGTAAARFARERRAGAAGIAAASVDGGTARLAGERRAVAMGIAAASVDGGQPRQNRAPPYCGRLQ
jgi:hypothetical protein